MTREKGTDVVKCAIISQNVVEKDRVVAYITSSAGDL